ncbi:uncharacterized protein LOC121260160 [Juglans microcarpa x Juglans regia]|uniref:uncharacterized protein LOC121260160 n=1 Tax=Juglans microcarpa x Juglans regia TaxID=2249226 RepID=UPI001B7F3BBB|nr:uncharacterized protein LOC121260160 [Juglans microcarpa x Juglans regia]
MIGRLVKNLNKPPSEFVKANWDAALNLRTKRMGIGIIVRDEGGEVLVIVCVQKKYVSQVALAESYTLWKAIEICNDLDIRNVILEGDALTIVNVVNRDDEDLSWFGHIIEDIKFYPDRRKDWKVVYTPRESNIAAYMLAK